MVETNLSLSVLCLRSFRMLMLVRPPVFQPLYNILSGQLNRLSCQHSGHKSFRHRSADRPDSPWTAGQLSSTSKHVYRGDRRLMAAKALMAKSIRQFRPAGEQITK